MGAIELTGSLAYPNHVGGPAVELVLVLPGQGFLVRQDQPLMRHGKFRKLLLDELGGIFRMLVTLQKTLIARIPVVLVCAVDIVALVIVDFVAIEGYELGRSGLGVLACDTTDQMGWLALDSRQGCLALLEEANFFCFRLKVLFRISVVAC